MPHRLVQTPASTSPAATPTTSPAETPYERLRRKVREARDRDADRLSAHGHKLAVAVTAADLEWLLARTHLTDTDVA